MHAVGGTGDKGNGHVVDRLMTTNQPLALVIMELSTQLRRRNRIAEAAALSGGGGAGASKELARPGISLASPEEFQTGPIIWRPR